MLSPLTIAVFAVSGSATFMFSKGIYRTADLQAVCIPDSLQTWVLNPLYSGVSVSWSPFDRKPWSSSRALFKDTTTALLRPLDGFWFKLNSTEISGFMGPLYLTTSSPKSIGSSCVPWCALARWHPQITLHDEAVSRSLPGYEYLIDNFENEWLHENYLWSPE